MTESAPQMQNMLETIAELMREGKWADSLISWEHFATRYSDLSAAYLGLARQLRDLGRIEEAEKLFSKMLNRFPTMSQPALDYAMMAYARHEWTEAIRRFQTVRSRFPDVLDAHRVVGDLL